MGESRWVRRGRLGSWAFAWGAFGLALGAALLGPAATSGCTTHQCDPSCVLLGAGAGSACVDGGAPSDAAASPGGCVPKAWIDGNNLLWESCAPEGPWLDYPGSRTYLFNWAAEFEAALAGSPNAATLVAALPEPWQVMPYISNGDPSDPNSRTVIAAGSVAEWQMQSNQQMLIVNTTCQDYLLRVVVYVSLAGVAIPRDAGAAD